MGIQDLRVTLEQRPARTRSHPASMFVAHGWGCACVIRASDAARFAGSLVCLARRSWKPDPEQFLDEVLREVGERRDANKRLVRGASSRSASGGEDGGGGGVFGGGGAGAGPGEGERFEAGGGGGGAGGAIKYSLRASSAGEYDPTFVRLNRTDHQVRRSELTPSG